MHLGNILQRFVSTMRQSSPGQANANIDHISLVVVLCQQISRKGGMVCSQFPIETVRILETRDDEEINLGCDLAASIQELKCLFIPSFGL